jgi:3,4-dihydroxy-9,10-secoandrosta-1,3,5(10)-triene-9,17-dione 4,5-dioxygenase
MAQVMGLGYLVVDATDIDAWRRFGTQALGMMEMPAAVEGGLHLKMDERQFRLAILPSDEDRLVCTGWELADDLRFDAALEELSAAGHGVKEASPDERAARHVSGLATVTDPSGATIELFYGPVFDHTVLISPVGVSRFVTGELGMGHVVMLTPNVEETYRFYTDLLGFRLSDTLRRGDRLTRFTHCNARHHSLAFAPADESKLQHFMVEVGTMDDVGYAYDRFEDMGIRILQTIGKHTNDHMTSFYARTPGPFAVEFGHGGRHIDDATWTSGEITAGAFWGHRRPPKPPT